MQTNSGQQSKKFITLKSRYIDRNIGKTNLTPKACLYLAQLQLKKVWVGTIIFDLGNNKIGDEGCQFLSKSEWSNLTLINLRKQNDIKESSNIG